jgi:hypothetical protein
MVPTQKDIEFVKFLFESTKAGKLQWQPTAKQNEFTATLQGKYRAFTSSIGSYPDLELLDDSDQTLLKLSTIEIEEVGQLYEFVRRKALNVDSVLDDLMRGERKG